MRIGLVFALILALNGCASFNPAKVRTVVVSPGAAATWRRLPVETGQIIMNEHPGATSLFLSLTAQRFAPYVHAGIVVMEEGRPYVYESMGIILPLPWRTPNQSVGGGVRRVSLDTFLLRGGIVAIYSPDPAIDRTALAEFARARLREKKPFDGHYDASDPSKYYCVEFVARALEAAGCTAPGAGTDHAKSFRSRRARLAGYRSARLLARRRTGDRGPPGRADFKPLHRARNRTLL